MPAVIFSKMESGATRFHAPQWCIFAALLAMLIQRSPLRAAEPVVADPEPSRFETEIRAFESWDRQNSVPPDAILFVGSSSIRLWPTAESFPKLPVINRGFGGSHISDVIHFADRIVLKYKPRVIVFYSGDNDIAGGKSPQQVFDDFHEFAQRVHNRLPQTRILFLAIKPSIARQKFWPQMKKANSLVERLAKDDQLLEFVDTASPMLENGRDAPPPTLFLADGLHLNAEGYKLWTKTLIAPLERVLKRK